ncbi:DUF418 domain-containing protein [Mucilaginibacter endophyticus]|uniref:DUF418 domain-containing protein n=1 Tax=Mucilaginibacter endophyticus TaxID=2675003 RepID=UPI000E0DF189
MGLLRRPQRYEPIGVALAIWVFQISFSDLWLPYFIYGLFEWVWRSLSYLKVQALKKQAG